MFICSVLAPLLCIKIDKSETEPSRKRQTSKDRRTMKKSRVAMEEPEIIRLEPMEEVQEISLVERNGYKESFKERQDAINQLINMLQRKHHEEVKEDEVFREWRDIAFVLDRLLFVVFLLIITVATVCILEMRPSEVDF